MTEPVRTLGNTIELELAEASLGILCGGTAGYAAALRFAGMVVEYLTGGPTTHRRITVAEFHGQPRLPVPFRLTNADESSVSGILIGGRRTAPIEIDSVSSAHTLSIDGATSGAVVLDVAGVARDQFWAAVDQTVADFRKNGEIEVICPWE